MTSTVTGFLLRDSTVYPLLEYSDAQFYADLQRSKKKLKAMARRASRDHRKGRTRRFP